MSSSIVHPVTVSHRGMTVLFVSDTAEDGTRTISYNVLDPSRGNADNALDWLGYRELPFPTQVATAGMSVGRQTREVRSTGLFCALSDQQYIYLFRSAQNSIYVNRYGLVQVPADNPESPASWELQPTWEVRYRRSGKADLAANDHDAPSPRDMDGQPFIDPIYELPLGIEGLDLARASFSANILPTSEEGAFRWQLFVPNPASGRIATYSFARTSDGWFEVALAPGKATILPDAEIELNHGEEAPLRASGPVTTTTYARQEPVFTDSSGVVNMKRATRVLLAAPVLDDKGATALVTIDFGVSLDGTLAGLRPPAGERVVTWKAGKVQPAGSMLEFDGASAMRITDDQTPPLLLPQTFTIEAWLNPASYTLDEQYVVGGLIEDPQVNQAPSLFIVDRLRVGVSFGDGTQLIRNVSAENVLTVNAWNHVAVTNSAAGMQIFVNGALVKLQSPPVPNATPVQTPVTSVGARAQWQSQAIRGSIEVASTKTEDEYVGLMDELRIWDRNLDASEIAKYLYREIPAEEAGSMANLVGYWRMDDGQGKIVTDLSAFKRNGLLSGPRWESTTSPVLPEEGAQIYFDEDSLTSVVGILLPEEDHPDFGRLAADSRPALLDGADGLVHLYFQGAGSNTFFGAQFDTTIDRAYYMLPWVAASTPKDAQNGPLVLVARQSGSALNQAVFKVEPSGHAALCNVTLDDGRGATETWRGVPRNVAGLIAALNGTAISQPLDRRLNDLTRLFYDYSGTIPMAIKQVGEADLGAVLWFLSARSGPFELKRIKLGQSQDGKADLTISVASDGPQHDGELLWRTLRGVPTDPAAFAQTISGANQHFDYSAASNPDGTIVYAIPGAPVPASLFIPSGVEAHIRVFPAANGDGTRCDFEVTLNPATGAGPKATWRAVSREGSKFVAEVYAGSEPDQKKVLELIRIMNPGHTTIVDGEVTQASNVMPFLSTFNAVNDGVTGEFPAFECEAAVYQGSSANLAQGSKIVAATLPLAPTNGYPAFVDLGTHTEIIATMLKPGKDGGWLNEPARVAVRIRADGLLQGSAGTQDAKALAPSTDLTVEAWARMLDSPPGLDPFYPRIVQNVIARPESVDKYMLGLAMTSTLQFLRGTAVSTSDVSVPDGSERMRLFPQEDYTIQFYIRPDFSTPTDLNTLFVKVAAGGTLPLERLSANVDGSLVYTIEPVGGPKVTSGGPPSMLKDLQWQCVTITRTAAALTVYIDGQPGQFIPTPPSTKTPHTALTVGNNVLANALQMRLNDFSVWSVALSQEQIQERIWKVLPRDDLGLQLMWGMDDGLRNKLDIYNSATATSGYYDTVAAGDKTFWNYPGIFYRAFFACRDFAVRTQYAVAAGARKESGNLTNDWHHFAGLNEAKYGLQFDGTHYADCGNDGSLNMRDALSLEAWVWPTEASSIGRRAIVSKYGHADANRSYELGLDTQNQPYLTVRLDGQRLPSGADVPERLRLRTFTAPITLPKAKPSCIVGTAKIITMTDAVGDRDVYSLAAQVYVDGLPRIPGPEQAVAPAASDKRLYRLDVLGGKGSGYYAADDLVEISANDRSIFTDWRGMTQLKNQADPKKPIPVVVDTALWSTQVKMPANDVAITAVGVFDHIAITQSSTPMNLARALSESGDAGTAYYSGGLSDVRIWNQALAASSIRRSFELRQLPAGNDGLISYYAFRKQEGNIAYDQQSTNNGTISSSRLWTTFHDAARLEIFVDGVSVPLEACLPGDFGSWGPEQISAGGWIDTHQAYRDSLLGDIDELRVWSTQRTAEQIADNMNRFLVGDEAGLVGYWRFDAGSGRVVADQTVNNNNLVFAEKLVDATPEWVTSTAPISNEAPVVQNAIDGLRTRYVASISEGPSVFEYPDSEVDAYGQAFAVMKRGYVFVSEGSTRLVVGYKVGDLQRVYIGQVQTKPQLVGFVEGTPPIPSENLTRPYYLDPIAMYFTYEGISSVELTEKGGKTVKLGGSRKDTAGIESKLKAGLSGDTKVYNGVQVPFGPTIMYQEVKSEWNAGLVAQLEWGKATSKGTSVEASAEYSRSIAVESAGAWEEAGKEYMTSGERRWLMNNRGVAVVKSATADMYGLFIPSTGALAGLSLVPNNDIPIDTNLIYFPIDPSVVSNGSLDGRVGFQADPACQGQPSYFRPVEAYSYARTIEHQTAQLDAWYQQFDPSQRALAFNSDVTDAISSNPFYDWSARVGTKSLMNKYVWAAGGGLYSEQTGYTSKRQESFGGDSDISWKLGGAGDLMFTIGPIGLHFELEVLGGMGWTVTVDKDQDEDSALELEVEIKPEGFLGRFLSLEKEPHFSETPVPGKVDTYRFNSYYLAPSTDNSDEFVKVVDPNWLKFSNTPQAAELNEAIAASAGKKTWRVLHRVTFVSRVPPDFQTVPVASQAPPIAEPVRRDNNELLLELAKRRLEGGKVTPALISSAVRAVYLEDMNALIPWWASFLSEAAVTNSEQSSVLQGIIMDSIAYVSEHYAAAGEATVIRASNQARALRAS